MGRFGLFLIEIDFYMIDMNKLKQYINLIYSGHALSYVRVSSLTFQIHTCFDGRSRSQATTSWLFGWPFTGVRLIVLFVWKPTSSY